LPAFAHQAAGADYARNANEQSMTLDAEAVFSPILFMTYLIELQRRRYNTITPETDPGPW
jgi:hypothetical protein